jgi:hypothetical protein
MRDSLKSVGRWLRVGWFWPLALLTLPMCGLFFEEPTFDPGPSPVTSAIMCDIPKVVGEGTGCATADEAGYGMSLAAAAVALNLGETNPVVLDFSSDATKECGGLPRKIEFHGPFPDGLAVCLNCGTQIPGVYAGAFDVCVAKCKDLLNSGEGPTPSEGVDAFCTANVRVSTNFAKDACYDNFCSTGGTPIPDAADPRRNPEDVTWVDLINTSAAGSTLSFTGPEGPEPAEFSAGAASEQLIMTGDAWVEFEVAETGVSHGVGVRTSCAQVTSCPDMDPTLAGLPLWLSLNVDGSVYIIEDGDVLAGPFPPYVAGERFRIRVTDHNDSTADIAFFRYTTPCRPNMPCSDQPFYSYTGASRPNYPLRVDAIFREAPSSLQNVTIMRIK